MPHMVYHTKIKMLTTKQFRVPLVILAIGSRPPALARPTDLSMAEIALEETERSFGDVSIVDTNAKLKWNCEGLQMTLVSGSLQCRWKDQGWGNQKGKLYLRLIAPDGSEKASHTVTEGVSPHQWEDVKVDLVATDPVVAEASVGCWYQVMMECGEGGGHELNVEGLALQLSGENSPV